MAGVASCTANNSRLLQYDTACLFIVNEFNFSVDIYAQPSDCYQCDPQFWVGVPLSTFKDFVTDAVKPVTLYAVEPINNETICQRTVSLDEHEIATWTLNQNCTFNVDREGEITCLPLYVFLMVFVISLLLFIGIRLMCKSQWMRNLSAGDPVIIDKQNDQGKPISSVGTPPQAKSKFVLFKKLSTPRIQALDVFRGMTIALMIFVNYGGGKYWFFQHSAWNGLTIADMVFPWFAWMMGVSLVLSYRYKAQSSGSRWYLFGVSMRRTIVLVTLGFVLNSFNNNDLDTVRFCGVLQRLGAAYLIVSTLETVFMKKQPTLQAIPDEKPMLVSGAQVKAEGNNNCQLQDKDTVNNEESQVISVQQSSNEAIAARRPNSALMGFVRGLGGVHPLNMTHFLKLPAVTVKGEQAINSSPLTTESKNEETTVVDIQQQTEGEEKQGDANNPVIIDEKPMPVSATQGNVEGNNNGQLQNGATGNIEEGRMITVQQCDNQSFAVWYSSTTTAPHLLGRKEKTIDTIPLITSENEETTLDMKEETGDELCEPFKLYGCWLLFPELVETWRQWLVILALTGVHVYLTLFYPVPGCPTGYLGPGGLGGHSAHPNCTGGAARYIDSEFFGDDHLYQRSPVGKVYHTTVPFDPEGILGTLTTCLTIYLGVQAGYIILSFNSATSRSLRWLFWAVLTGVSAGFLCGWSTEEGLIPVNKQLWSLSFALLTSSAAFLLLTVFFIAVDHRCWWRGGSFKSVGRNAILLYVGHIITKDMLPWSWKAKDVTSHAQFFHMNVIGTLVWCFIAVLLHRRQIFITI